MWKLPSAGTKGALERKSLPNCLYWCPLCVKPYSGHQSYRCAWDPTSLPSRSSLENSVLLDYGQRCPRAGSCWLWWGEAGEASELAWEVGHLASGPGLFSVPFAGPSVPIWSTLMSWTTLAHPFRFQDPNRTGTFIWPIHLHPQGRKSICGWKSTAGSFTNCVVCVCGGAEVVLAVPGAWTVVLGVYGDEGHHAGYVWRWGCW